MNKEQFDEKMDEVSREASMHQSLPFTEEAWTKMELLLDQKQKRRRFIIWWWVTPIALLAIVFGVYFQLEKNKNHSIKEAIATNKKSDQIASLENNNQVSGKDFKENNSIITPNKTAQVEPKEIDDYKTENKKNIPSGKIKTKAVSKQPVFSNPSIKSSKSAISLSTQKTNGSQPFTQKETQSESSITINNTTENKKTTIDSLTLTSNKAEQLIAVKNKIDSTSQKLDSNANPIAQKDKLKNKKSLLSKLEINASVAADITSIQFRKVEQLSTAYGIGITFFINKKISIATGIGFAKKIYNADSSDYHSLPYLPRNSVLNNIAADCRVIEVPINIQYLLSSNKKSGWLGAVGISNYFMKSESYDYNYTYYGVTKSYLYTYNKQNNHLLSVLNLAVAYRHQINQQWSWQLSPYVKIPLTGIGQGKVQLMSTGIQGNLNFRLKK